MRLSNLVVTAFLIVPLTVFAQHSSGGGGGGSSASSGGGGGHSGGGYSGGGSSGGSHASSGGGSHGSSGGSFHGGSSHGSVSHAGSHANSAGHNTTGPRAGTKPVNPGAMPGRGTARPGTSTAQPERRGFFAFLRHPFGRPKPTPGDPDLRHRVCLDGHCKEPTAKPAEPQVAELRNRVCTGAQCAACPAGQMRGKGGACVAAPSTNVVCGSGSYWNGSQCAVPSCQLGEFWNGASCVANFGECAGFTGRAAMLANEIRQLRSQMQMACSAAGPAPDCETVRQQYEGAISQYRILQNSAPIACRTMLGDPMMF